MNHSDDKNKDLNKNIDERITDEKLDSLKDEVTEINSDSNKITSDIKDVKKDVTELKEKADKVEESSDKSSSQSEKEKIVGNSKEAKQKRKPVKKEKIQVDRRNKTLKRASILSVIVLIAIVIAFNVILNAIAGNKLQFDWTANKAATLGDVSKQLLSENDKEVKITVLSNRDEYAKGYQSADLSFLPNLLEQYEENSKGLLSVEYVDPVQNPSILQTIDPNSVLGLTRYQMVISNTDYSKTKILNYQDFLNLEAQQQQSYITGYRAEEAISNALRFVGNEESPVAYISSGHGESAIEESYNVLKLILEQNNYMVKTLDTVTNAIPEDAELLMMIAPTKDISSNEVDSYMNFLKQGGSLLLLANYDTSELKNINSLLNKFDLKLTTDRIQENDTNYIFQYYENSFVATIPENTMYTPDANYNMAVVIDAAAISNSGNSEEWIQTESLLNSTDQATLQIGGNPDKQSPSPAKQNVAMLSINKGFVDGSKITDPAKVAVFGSSLQFTDTLLSNYASNYLLANSTLAYMSNMEENAMSDLLIQPKPVVSYSLAPGNQGMYRFISISFLILVPVALLVTALVVYNKRKKL